MNDIGIGILDFYTQKDLNDLLNSIPKELHQDIYIVSTTNNTAENTFLDRFKNKPPLGFLRNKILSHFRNINKKNIFLIESNVCLLNENYLHQIIKTAKIFGCWVMTTPEKNSIIIEEEDGTSLHLTPHLDTSFLFLYSGVISNIGYFNEQYVSAKGIEVLDYINRCRKRGIYPSFNFNPSVKEGILVKKTNNPYQVSDDSSKAGVSLGLFQHLYGYIPGHNDPKNISQSDLIKEMENIQNNFAIKI